MNMLNLNSMIYHNKQKAILNRNGVLTYILNQNIFFDIAINVIYFTINIKFIVGWFGFSKRLNLLNY